MSERKILYKTGISKAFSDDVLIRGYSLNQLVGNISLGGMLYLLIQGQLPTKPQEKMIEAILVTCCEHGVRPPSIQAARLVASGGTQFQACIAGGILALGDSHGGAIDICMKILQAGVLEAKDKNKEIPEMAVEIVSFHRQEKKRIPGFGHPTHKVDPRTTQLFSMAENLGIKGDHSILAEQVEKTLIEQTGRNLPLNVDGAVAALLSDMNFDYQVGKGFFVIGRACGMVAHVLEEKVREKPLVAHLPPEDMILYDGPEKRNLPWEAR